MQIHHTKVKQAMDIGCYVSMLDANQVRIFWPQRAVELVSPTVDEALVEMRAAQHIVHNYGYRVITSGIRVIVVNDDGYQMNEVPKYPSVLLAALEAGEDEWTKPPNGNPPEPVAVLSDRIDGIPKSGLTAYREGVPASDCPFPEESDEFSHWNEEWDEAADEATAEEAGEDVPRVGSIVTSRYRANYAELGHPTHCGDDLAILLNSICQNKAGTNLDIFEAVCAANSVSLAKYNRTKKGWQGRLRMTGRNLLAKKVLEQQGKLLMPPGFGTPHYQLDANWLAEAQAKYKPKG